MQKMYYINQNKNDIEMIAKPPFSENWMRNIVYPDGQKMNNCNSIGVTYTVCEVKKEKEKLQLTQ